MTPDQTPSKVQRSRIALLTRRRDHLYKLLSNGDRTDHNWMAAEAAALTWALWRIAQTQEPAND